MPASWANFIGTYSLSVHWNGANPYFSPRSEDPTMRSRLLATLATVTLSLGTVVLCVAPASAVTDTRPPASTYFEAAAGYVCASDDQVRAWEAYGDIVVPDGYLSDCPIYDVYAPRNPTREHNCGDGRSESVNDAIAYAQAANLTDPNRSDFLGDPCGSFDYPVSSYAVGPGNAQNQARDLATDFEQYMASQSLPITCDDPTDWSVTRIDGTYQYNAVGTFTCYIS